MILVKDIAKELSIKIGDPRDDGDGILFYREDRLRYISRSYGKLIRVLSMAMRKYKPGFVLPLEPFDIEFSSEIPFKNPIPFKKPFVDMEEVIVKIGNKRILASKLDPKNYNQAKYGLNTINVPDAARESIFYSVIGNKLYILPETTQPKYSEINAMGVADLPSELTVDTELPIDKVYADLLITLAAIEAMNDLPHPQKVQLYRQELLDQISVITAYTNLMERREGETGNG